MQFLCRQLTPKIAVKELLSMLTSDQRWGVMLEFGEDQSRQICSTGVSSARLGGVDGLICQ